MTLNYDGRPCRSLAKDSATHKMGAPLEPRTSFFILLRTDDRCAVPWNTTSHSAYFAYLRARINPFATTPTYTDNFSRTLGNYESTETSAMTNNLRWTTHQSRAGIDDVITSRHSAHNVAWLLPLSALWFKPISIMYCPKWHLSHICPKWL